MNASVEERLRRHYDERTSDLPARGPGLSASSAREVGLTGGNGDRPWPHRRIAAAVCAAAAAVVVGLILANGAGHPGGTPLPGDIPPPLAPAETLPVFRDLSSGATAVGTEPTSWYRLQPDLDVAWYRVPGPDGPSMFCWRTPARSDCQVDASTAVLPTAGGQTVVFVAGDRTRTVVDLRLADDFSRFAPIVWDPNMNWGVARFALPIGAEVERVEAIVAPTTLPMASAAPTAAPRAEQPG